MAKWPPETDVEAGSNAEQPPRPPPHWAMPLPKPWFVWMVPLIFVANVVVFAYTMYYNDCPRTTGAEYCVLYNQLGRFSFQPLKENYVLGPSAYTLERLGALDQKVIVQDGEWWRLFTNVWLHAGVVHLFANMLSLLMVGIRLEEEFGFCKFLFDSISLRTVTLKEIIAGSVVGFSVKIGLLYVVSGFGGSLMSAIYTKSSISVGASGALLGLLGAMLSELIENWTIYANKCATITSLVAIIALNLVIGFIPRVDNYAHTGGFLTGFFFGFVLLVRPQYGYVSRRHIPEGFNVKHKKPKYRCYQHVLWAAALVLLTLGISFGLFKLYKV